MKFQTIATIFMLYVFGVNAAIPLLITSLAHKKRDAGFEVDAPEQIARDLGERKDIHVVPRGEGVAFFA